MISGGDELATFFGRKLYKWIGRFKDYVFSQN